MDLQLRLVKLGTPLSADGLFGSETEAAVLAFQRRQGMVDDGVVGPRTWAHLLQAAGEDPGTELTQRRSAAERPLLRRYDGFSSTTPELNADVQDLQAFLNKHGEQLPVDGYFGPRTEDTVRTFQRRAGLAGTGTVDVRTWAALMGVAAVETGDGAEPALGPVGKDRARELAHAIARRERWQWSDTLPIFDRGSWWRICPDRGIVIEINKETGKVVVKARDRHAEAPAGTAAGASVAQPPAR